jgi:two-component system chemotaxis response regulator CheY
MTYTVLLCDDAMLTRVMITGIISDAGYLVIGQAESGEEAVEQYNRLRPDIVVLDMLMPGMSGLDATRAIHQIDPEARIVLCGPAEQGKLREEAMAAGARSLIVKPFTRARVLEAFHDAVR